MPSSAPSAHAQKPENPDFKTELLGLVPFLRALAPSLSRDQEGADGAEYIYGFGFQCYRKGFVAKLSNYLLKR